MFNNLLRKNNLLFLFLRWKPSLSSLPCKAILITQSITMTKRYGANVSSCKTQTIILKVSVSPSVVTTLAVVFSYIMLIAVTKYSGIP